MTTFQCISCLQIFTGPKQTKRCRSCNRFKNIEYHRDRYYDNIDIARKRNSENARVFRERNPEIRLWRAARDRATRCNLDFDIEVPDIVIPEICPVLKVPLYLKTKFAPSLDRIIPSKGYIKGNIQVISRKANLMKQDATQEELERFADWVKLSTH